MAPNFISFALKKMLSENGNMIRRLQQLEDPPESLENMIALSGDPALLMVVLLILRATSGGQPMALEKLSDWIQIQAKLLKLFNLILNAQLLCLSVDLI
jgi:hypothetical protein